MRVGGFNVNSYETLLNYQKEINYLTRNKYDIKNQDSDSKKISDCRTLRFNSNIETCPPDINYSILENSFTNNKILNTTIQEKLNKKCKNSKVTSEPINIDSKLPDFYYYKLNENRSRGFKFPCSNIYLDTEEYAGITINGSDSNNDVIDISYA